MTIKCVNWNESEGLNGAAAFCKVAAYNGKLTASEAKMCGCTKLKRAACLKAMVASNGFGLVPEIYEEVPVIVEGTVKATAFGVAL